MMGRRRFVFRGIGILLTITSALPIGAVLLLHRLWKEAARRTLEHNGIDNAAERASEFHFEVGWIWALVPLTLALLSCGIMLVGGAALLVASRSSRLTT